MLLWDTQEGLTEELEESPRQFPHHQPGVDRLSPGGDSSPQGPAIKIHRIELLELAKVLGLLQLAQGLASLALPFPVTGWDFPKQRNLWGLRPVGPTLASSS